MFTTVGNFIGDKFACYSAHFVIGKLMEKSLIIERYWLFWICNTQSGLFIKTLTTPSVFGFLLFSLNISQRGS